MRFGVGVPQMSLGHAVGPELIREFVTRAERDGYDSLWVMDTGAHIDRAVAELAAMPLLTYTASLTSRIRLGTSVLLTGLRDPVWLAQELTTLDHLTAGRLIVGVGLGSPERAELLGIAREESPGRFEESLEVLRALWAPGTATFTGKYWRFSDLALEPKPVQRPHPPLWFGARAPRALHRAVTHGSGWMGAGASSSDDFVTQKAHVDRYLEAEDRDPTEFVISKRVYIAVDDDLRRIEAKVRAFFAGVYGNPDLGSRCALFGPPEKCAEGLAGLRSAGADMLVLNPMFDYHEQLDALTTGVVPLMAR